MMEFILLIGIFIIELIWSFLMTALAWWVICFAFGIGFSWKIALGVWAVLALLRTITKATSKSGR